MNAPKYASLKVSPGLYNDAVREAPVFNRSLSGQVEHWARLGQAVEAGPGVTLERVRAALQGRFPVESLTPDEQDYFFDLLGEGNTIPTVAEERFSEKLRRQGGSYGYDELGRLVRGLPDGSVEVIAPAA